MPTSGPAVRIEEKKRVPFVHINAFSPGELCLLISTELPEKLPFQLEVSKPELADKYLGTIVVHAIKFARDHYAYLGNDVSVVAKLVIEEEHTFVKVDVEG